MVLGLQLEDALQRLYTLLPFTTSIHLDTDNGGESPLEDD